MLQSGLKIGGQIPWHVIPICETLKISCPMGKLHTKVVLENLLRTHHSVWFIGSVSPYNCEGLVKNPSIWKECLTWIVHRICSVCGGNLEGWYIGCRHWGVGNDGRIRNLLSKTQCEGSNISKRKWRISISNRRWTKQTFLRRPGTENTHLDTGTSNSRRTSQRFSWRIRRVSTFYHLNTLSPMPVKR